MFAGQLQAAVTPEMPPVKEQVIVDSVLTSYLCDNFDHKHSGIKYVTPAERHQGNDMKILAARKAVYQLAREQHPERWGKHLRNWDYISEVYLNPEKEAA